MAFPFSTSSGVEILDTTPLKAFRSDPVGLFEAILCQFEDWTLFARELAQNSADAKATTITVTYSLNEIGDTLNMSWIDDACGMCIDDLQKYYFTLFYSSKEDDDEAAGFFSAGRVSMFAAKPKKVELITLKEKHDGYRVEIFTPNFNAKIFRVAKKLAARLIGHDTGTRVDLYFPVEGRKKAVEKIKAINYTIKKCAKWIEPKITIMEVEDE